MIHNTKSVQISQKEDKRNVHAIMKTMCPPSYHHSAFVATHALGHDVWLHIAGTNEPKSAQQEKQGA